ncbi:MAG: DUF3164 family protein [Rhodobacteraceae bacterium]|nr:DUF3164 family protein [Paracoccaceae bacterium]MCW9041718.1 DUF3164 family protein [Pseudopelagicola sp.]
MSDTDLTVFKDLMETCPHDIRRQPFAWAKWMRNKGFVARMRADLLHQYITDHIAQMADWGGPDTCGISSGIVEVHGQKHLRDAKGALVPMSMVKAQDQLEDETVRKIIGYAEALSDQVTRFKEHTFNDLGDFEAVLMQDYDLKKGGAKGNKTFLSFDGCQKVQVAVADHIDFGPQLQIAKELIDECLNEWAADARDEIRTIVTRAFNTDKAGAVNRSEIFMLLRLDITDERWQKAMSAIRDAMRVVGSKTYVRCYKRETPDAAWQPITIDLAKA